LAVDAGWGTGKTTFLKMWSQQLQNEGFTVVQLNAWETDFTGDPFLSISAEVTRQLECTENSALRNKVEQAKKTAGEVAIRAIPALVRIGTAGILDLSPAMEGEIGRGLASVAEDRLARYSEAQGSLSKFKKSLQELAENIASSSEGLPLIIVVDELDRCRPTYAVEMLEVAKHLFSADHVIFVLAINREQIIHSVGAVYGSGFDSDIYLQRFIDVDFRLRAPDRNRFIWSTIDSLKIEEYFVKTTDKAARHEFEHAKRLLSSFLSNSGVSLREIEQALNRLALVFASLRSDTRVLGIAVAVALILRTIDKGLYRQFIRGEIEDLELADAIFCRGGLASVRSDPAAWLFESVLIVGELEVKGIEATQQGNRVSPLWNHYKRIMEREESENMPVSRRQTSAGQIIHTVSELMANGSTYNNNTPLFFQSATSIGFGRAVERLELFANDLIDIDSAKEEPAATDED